MCILLCTRKHPDYPIILASNRDEYFQRPTKLASFIDDEIMSPEDLGRKEHGSWIGISKKGKIAVLVNYREPASNNHISKISRGSIPMNFLKSDLPPLQWAKKYEKEMDGFKDIGGFSLLFGTIKVKRDGEIEPLYIMSNRYDETISIFNCRSNDTSIDPRKDVQFYDTIGLSNSPYLEPWPKVREGKRLLDNMVGHEIDKDKIISQLFNILSVSNPGNIEEWNHYRSSEGFYQMPKSIFIPPIERESKNNIKVTGNENIPALTGTIYGTRTQTVILVDKKGNVDYIERNLHSSDNIEETPQVHRYQFKIQGWPRGEMRKENKL